MYQTLPHTRESSIHEYLAMPAGGQCVQQPSATQLVYNIHHVETYVPVPTTPSDNTQLIEPARVYKTEPMES